MQEISKQELRKTARKRIKEMTDVQKKDESLSVCEALKSMKEFSESDFIAAFMPLPDEINIFPFLEESADSGKTILLPRIIPGTNEMNFFEVSKNQIESLKEGSFGIKEPDADNIKIDFKSMDILKKLFFVIPGLAFTESGKRLGRGKGFYDRFLSELPCTLSRCLNGVCYSCQVFDDDFFPCEENDIKMDRVIFPHLLNK